jgi:hypothetical protein
MVFFNICFIKLSQSHDLDDVYRLTNPLLSRPHVYNAISSLLNIFYYLYSTGYFLKFIFQLL